MTWASSFFAFHLLLRNFIFSTSSHVRGASFPGMSCIASEENSRSGCLHFSCFLSSLVFPRENGWEEKIKEKHGPWKEEKLHHHLVHLYFLPLVHHSFQRIHHPFILIMLWCCCISSCSMATVVVPLLSDSISQDQSDWWLLSAFHSFQSSFLFGLPLSLLSLVIPFVNNSCCIRCRILLENERVCRTRCHQRICLGQD